MGINSGSYSYVAGLIFLVSVVYFFSGIFFGIDFTDSFFHLNQARDPANGTLLLPFFLSTVFLKLIMDLVGNDLIILRFVHSLCLVSSVFIPFVIVRPKISVSRMLLMCSVVLILFAPLNFNILSYDSFSIFSISFIFAVLLLFLQKRKVYLLVILSFLTAISVLLRFPNILFVPLIFLFLHVNETKRTLKDPYYFLLIVGLIIAGGYFLYYDNMDMLSNSSVSFSFIDFKVMVVRYFRDALTLMLFTAFLLFSYLAFLYLKKNRRNKLWAYGLIIVIYPCFIWGLVLFSNYSQDYAFLLTSICLTYIIINLVKGKSEGQHVLLLFLSFLMLYPIGSNTGLLKSCTIFLLFPIVYFVNKHGVSKFWLLILMLLVPFSFLEKLNGTYEEKPITALTSTVDLPELYPIKTSETRYSFLKEVDSKVKDLQERGVQVYFYGNKSHIFHYLYPGSDLNLKSFYQPVHNLSLYEKIDKELSQKENSAVFLIDSYPEDGVVVKNSLLGEQLQQAGLQRISNNFSVYYIK